MKLYTPKKSTVLPNKCNNIEVDIIKGVLKIECLDCGRIDKNYETPLSPLLPGFKKSSIEDLIKRSQ